MSFNSYTPLTQLSSSRIKWNIRVRAQAVWKGITRETKEFRGINLILVDDSVSDLHIQILFFDKLAISIRNTNVFVII